MTAPVAGAQKNPSIMHADGLEPLECGAFRIHEAKRSLTKVLTEGTEGLRAMFTTRQKHAFDALQEQGTRVEVLGREAIRAFQLERNPVINVLPQIQMHVNSAIGPLIRGWP